MVSQPRGESSLEPALPARAAGETDSIFTLTRSHVRMDARALAFLALIVAVGALVRFWGLGNVGLHGDEKTMALPVLHLLQYGTPQMPSGFLYPRAIAQLYLMAGSVLAFGRSEWAFRFPSAVCGVVLIVLAWAASRRFLGPRWSLALAAAVALLPGFIEDAQTARMYVFLVTGVTAFMVLLFAWERTGRPVYLAAAVLEMAVSLEFHTLSVFAAWLCFLPGLLRRDRRMLWLGFLAFVLIAAEYLALNHWISIQYPHDVESLAGPIANAPRATGAPPLEWHWPLAAALPALALSWLAIRPRGWLPVALLTLSLIAQVTRLDHVAILLIVAALVVARRDGPLQTARLALYFAVCVALGAAQVAYLLAHRAGTLPQILGLLLGWPSVRPYIVIAGYSWVAAGVAACGAVAGLWRLAHRQPLPDHLLFLALGVWLPLLQIGYLRWDIAPRYAEAQIMPLLIAAFASAQWAVHWAAVRMSGHPAPETGEPLAVRWGSIALAAVLCVLIVNPMRLQAAVSPTYARYPDHIGAAAFVASLHPGPGDLIIAEDTLMQTYYLGRVDYWLMNRKVAAPYMHEVDGKWVDVYTDTPLIGTGRQLRRLVETRDRGAIYVIGDGARDQGGPERMLGLGIAQELASPPFRLIHVGRDGLTDVWKVDPPQRSLAARSGADG